MLQRTDAADVLRAEHRVGMNDLHPATQPSRYPVPRAHRLVPPQELVPTAQDDNDDDDDNVAYFPAAADDDSEQEHRPSMDTAPENCVAFTTPPRKD